MPAKDSRDAAGGIKAVHIQRWRNLLRSVAYLRELHGLNYLNLNIKCFREPEHLPGPPDDCDEPYNTVNHRLYAAYEGMRNIEGPRDRSNQWAFHDEKRAEWCALLMSDVNEMVATLVASGTSFPLRKVAIGDIVPIAEPISEDSGEITSTSAYISKEEINELLEHLHLAVDEAEEQLCEGDVPSARQPKPLRGWKQICSALGRPSTEWRSLKRLNVVKGGPIKTYGRGKPPFVLEHDLNAWLQRLQEEQPVAAEGETAEQKPQLPGKGWALGPKGLKVYTEVSMHEKRRRKDLGKKKKKNDQV